MAIGYKHLPITSNQLPKMNPVSPMGSIQEKLNEKRGNTRRAKNDSKWEVSNGVNRRQKVILRDFLTVFVITAVAVVAMIHFKDLVNRSEAMRAVEHLRQRIKQYRDEHGSVPSESWIDVQSQNLPGSARLGDLKYRGLWIDPDSTSDEILAYAERDYYSLFVGKGYIVLRLGAVLADDGRVEWMDRREFKQLLSQQQSPEEVRMQQQ